MQAKKRDEIDVCVVVGSQQFAMLPRHPNTHDSRRGLFFFRSSASSTPQSFAFALQFLVWLAENCEGEFDESTQHDRRDVYNLELVILFLYTYANVLNIFYWRRRD